MRRVQLVRAFLQQFALVRPLTLVLGADEPFAGEPFPEADPDFGAGPGGE